MENNVALFEQKYLDALKEYAELEKAVKELDEKKKTARAELLEAMGKYGVRSFENDFLKVTVVAPSISKTINTTELRREDPDTYDKLLETYPKVTERRESLRVTVR